VDGLSRDALPSFYIILETEIADFDGYVKLDLLAKGSDDLARTANDLELSL
jgi:hypothetical protein